MKEPAPARRYSRLSVPERDHYKLQEILDVGGEAAAAIRIIIEALYSKAAQGEASKLFVLAAARAVSGKEIRSIAERMRSQPHQSFNTVSGGAIFDAINYARRQKWVAGR